LKFDSSQTLSLGDSIVTNDTIEVKAGWNLIGTLGTSVETSTLETIPTGILSSGFFGYNAGYSASTVLQPGKGYWVKVSQVGQLVLTSTPLK
jgi:hypothetical protein